MLQNHLLPEKFSDTGTYPEKIFTRVLAFRVLCHAVFEEYFETRVFEIATAASKAGDRGKFSFSAACLVSFTEHSFGLPPDTIIAPQDNLKKTWNERVDIKTRLSKCATSHIRHARIENHGIREKNLLRLLLPIGVDFSLLDPILIAELDSFGERRGVVAHTSAKNHVRSKPDPKDELEKVNVIVNLLLDVDQKLSRVKASIR